MTSERMLQLFIKAYDRYNEFFAGYEIPRDNTLRLTYNGDNLDEIDVYISFGVLDSGAMLVNVNNFDLPNFSDKFAAGLLACNQANNDELVRYYIDEDKDAVVDAALYFNAFGMPADYSPEMALEMTIRVALSVDEVYPAFKRAKNS